jgi:HSP20 family protein
MRDDDRDDPFDDFFSELERMMNEMMGESFDMNVDVETGHSHVGGQAGFGTATHVDVHETDAELRVVADLPGVEKEHIDLRCDGEVLTISADGPERNYDERVRLPARVDETSASASYNNGVLEVVLERVDGATDIDVT